VLVAIPARNEAASVSACLASVDRAVLAAGRPALVVVAADRCTDDTADRAAHLALRTPLLVVSGSWGCASAARAAAVDVGLAHLGELGDDAWIANVDADCTVPPEWIRAQLAHAEHVDAVAGVVRLDPDLTDPALLASFSAAYPIDGARHRHVHAANLGVHARTYRRLGGWSRRIVVGEDHDLWRRALGAGCSGRQATDVWVTTSARTRSRVSGGFADDLARLEAAA
jgi:glycosyltransferase involved in cell wall biosynthesis